MSDLRIVKSRRDKKILEDKFYATSEYLPDAVPQSYFEAKKSDSKVFRDLLNIKQENIFLCLGRLHPLKGPQILVKALSLLKNKNVAAVFIGPDGGSRKQLFNLARDLGVADQVYILGYVDEETKMNAIDSSISLVVPSLCDYVEVFSISTSEAWARSKPVIASNIGELSYRIQNNENGLLVKPSNPADLANAISFLVTKPNLSVQMGLKGHASVSSWREVAEKSIELYSQVVSK